MKMKVLVPSALILLAAVAYVSINRWSASVAVACAETTGAGFRAIAAERDTRFLGKVQERTARCRGGDRAVEHADTPWVDWANYWATADASSRSAFGPRLLGLLSRNRRGIDGALLDLEYQRIELIKFNLFDNYTYEQYASGRDGVPGRALKVWNEMRLPPDHRDYIDVGGAGEQICKGELIRYRTLTGICNDIKNPAMGSTNEDFARNVPFETTFPIINDNVLVRNRHGDRLDLLTPDPQVISRMLFTRRQSQPELCNDGHGLPDYSAAANCDYKKAPFFNVLAAYWIQFMTHDWFSHLEEGHNSTEMMPVGCATRGVGSAERPLTADELATLRCRPDDRMERSYFSSETPPDSFTLAGRASLARAPKTTRNTVTAWWDASQTYGYDEISVQRVKRDPADPAKLLMVHRGNRSGDGEKYGYLPLFEGGDPINPAWAGQEAVAFPDNWTIGLSFLHNLFVREHNIFVDEFRSQAQLHPDDDSGLRNPHEPGKVIRYSEVTPEELYQVARLVVAAEIAKIHTTEWTTQLLYDDVLYEAMNANWHGLIREDNLASRVTERIASAMGASTDAERATQWYGVFASGAGIVGLGSRKCAGGPVGYLGLIAGCKDTWDLSNPDDVNGGTNHFGSPFNFPEEFVTVYRLHPLVPDLLEYREWNNDPNVIRKKIPVVETFRGRATPFMEEGGLANWGLTLGRQRLGLLTLQNHAQFLQDLRMPRLETATGQIDVAALDIVRDRERGVPRFNEFRRQYGLRQLTSFDDFIDRRAPEGSPQRADQESLAQTLRAVYGQHLCDDSKIITDAQLNEDGSPITDCLGHADGTVVDNVEDIDTVVGWLAEPTRPHGFAISETQFQVFILNASRRLFSDRFFTSSYRPEFYTRFGLDWVTNNGPGGRVIEHGKPNGHTDEVSPMKRVLLRAIPELSTELEHVVNAFDPWARDRGDYYSLEWKPRAGAETDVAFE
jgi:Animal haem peroxidase